MKTKKSDFMSAILVLTIISSLLLFGRMLADLQEKIKVSTIQKSGVVNSFRKSHDLEGREIYCFTIRNDFCEYSVPSRSNLDISDLDIRDSISFVFLDKNKDGLFQEGEKIESFWNYTPSVYDSE